MILRLFRRTQQDDTIASLYGAIVAQARLPVFYRDYSVPDTVNGRFEMIVLHAALLLRRLDGEENSARGLGQAVFDRFCADMDGNLREMGVGDLRVPRTMKTIGEAFYGRRRAYDTALATANAAPLAEALARNVYESDAGAGAGRLAAYARAAAAGLAAQEVAALRRGLIEFPDPAVIANPDLGTGTA